MGVEKYDEAVTISIVLTVFNHEKYLARAFDSILKQKTNFRFEVVIGDDESSDNSKSIILDYSKRHPDIFVPILRTLNLGGSKNFTDLLRRCRGKYFTFIDGDDYWVDENKLQIQYDYLESNPEQFSVAHKVSIRDTAGNPLGMVPGEAFSENRIAAESFLRGNRFALTSTMMRALYGQELKELISLVEAGPRNAGDLTICLFLLDKGSIPILKNPMSVYFYRSTAGESNYNSATKLASRIHDRLKMIDLNDNRFSGKYFFGWMYIRMFASAARGVAICKLNELPQLVYLMLQILVRLTRSTAFFSWNRTVSKSSDLR